MYLCFSRQNSHAYEIEQIMVIMVMTISKKKRQSSASDCQFENRSVSFDKMMRAKCYGITAHGTPNFSFSGCLFRVFALSTIKIIYTHAVSEQKDAQNNHSFVSPSLSTSTHLSFTLFISHACNPVFVCVECGDENDRFSECDVVVYFRLR